MQFTTNIIKFEAAFDTPIKDALQTVSPDKWDDLLDVVVADVQKYANDNNIEICRKTWTEYCKQANWQALVTEMFPPKKSIFSRIFT